MRRRTREDNRQLDRDEVQIEDLKGAISVRPSGDGQGVTVITTRGISGRKAQLAVLSKEGVDVLIKELKAAKKKRWG